MIAVGFALILPCTTAAAGTLTGIAQAIDGDTIRVGDVKVRLQGVNAPEKTESLATEANRFMADLVNGKPVTCHLDGTVTHDRVVGICFVAGTEIGTAIVAAGLARDCRRFSRGRYGAIEAQNARQSITEKPYCQARSGTEQKQKL
ncbi:MAG: thermonuclease family protein [Pseudomonadota bacterium]